jgi:tRNA(Ile2) C34 agmatinyltransferase TiaS
MESSSNKLVFKCKTCGMQFEEKKRFEIHKGVHGRKSKVVEYGDPEFSKDRLR